MRLDLSGATGKREAQTNGAALFVVKSAGKKKAKAA
jgi:hypothetical protein